MTTPAANSTNDIVREVLRRLTALEAPAHSDVVDSRTLDLDDRVVTLSSLDGQLNGKTNLVVRPDAIVTPAVQDELRERGIQLERGSSAATASAVPWYAAVVGASSSSISNWLQQCGGGHVESFECFREATDRACARAVDGCRAIVVSEQSAAAACHANRDQRIRAACGWDVSSIREALDTLSPNVLIVDPRRHNQYSFRTLIQTFTAQ
jgi:hypothetical protein